MKPKTRLAILFLPILLTGATHAEVFYSNLRDIAIPTDHTGIYLNILNAP